MRISVAYACNEKYMIQTEISIISLFENNMEIDEIIIYFIDMGITELSRRNLKELIDIYHGRLNIIPFSRWESDLPVGNTGRHIKSVYAKLFFGRINDLERILYIDSDTVIVDSIRVLWEMDMQKCVIAGVQTVSTLKTKEKIGLSKNDLVINDGVVLIDLNKWRKYNFEEKCIEFIKRWKGNPPILSEGTINFVCRGYLRRLSLRFNTTSACKDYTSNEIVLMTGMDYYSQKEMDEAAKNPCIIHYASGFHKRPWIFGSTHPYREEYLKYRKLSKWSSKPLEKSQFMKRERLVYWIHRILPQKLFMHLYIKFGRNNR